MAGQSASQSLVLVAWGAFAKCSQSGGPSPLEPTARLNVAELPWDVTSNGSTRICQSKTMTASIIEIQSPEWPSILGELRRTPPVVFVGSAVSCWAPSEFPNGQLFSRSVCEALFGTISGNTRRSAESEQERLLSLVMRLPFEHLLELAHAPDVVVRLIRDVYGRDASPNALHQRLTSALCTGAIAALVTTNYDQCFDHALRAYESLTSLTTSAVECDGSRDRPRSEERLDREREATHNTTRVVRVVTETEAAAYLAVRRSNALSPRCYFKVHGSAEEGFESSIVATLRQEGLLSPARRELLTELLTGRPVVLIGYSGLDFDLSPELARIPGVRLLWNNREAALPSDNARAVLAARNGVLLVGDMRVLLKAWFGPFDPEPAWKWTCTAGPTPGIFANYFSADVLAAWRVRVLANIGAPRLALDRLTADAAYFAPAFRQRETARAHFNAGWYRDAALEFKQGANVSTLTCEERADFWLDAADAWRAGGRFARAALSIARAWRVGVGRHRAKALLKWALLLENVDEGLRAANLSWAAQPVRALAVRVLQACAVDALAHGNHYDYQQTALVAERLGLPTDALAVGQSYAPPPAERGYKHLGYYLAEVSAFLAGVLAAPLRTRARAELATIVATIDAHVVQCDALGLSPLVWKLLAVRAGAAEIGYPMDAQRREKLATAFRQCQYRWLMRTLQLRRHGLASPPEG